MSSSRPLKHPCRFVFILCVAVSALWSAPASAGPIALGEWFQFGFTEAGVPATGCDPADPAGPFCFADPGTGLLDAPPWTFVAPNGGVTLTVSDAFTAGDRFEVFDFGRSLGFTSAPGDPRADCGNDPVACLSIAGISRALFTLAAGHHSITIVPILSPGELGSGLLRADAVVPEPATLMLVGSGLLFSLRRRSGRFARRVGRAKEAR